MDNQGPTRDQAAPRTATANMSNYAGTTREQPKHSGPGLLRRYIGLALKLLFRSVSASTTPGTENPEAQTTRSIWGSFKNLIMSLLGKGKPFYDASRSLRNTPWERRRGNDFSRTYESDGRMTLTLRDGVLSETALQMLSAIDASSTSELDPSSAGIGKFPDVGKMVQHNSDKELCDKLLKLRQHMEAQGGSMEVIPSSDGFGRVLKITIDPRNKTVEEVKKEIESIFSTLGVGGPQMAESIAKELVRVRDADRSAQDAGMSSTACHVPRQESRRTTSQELGMNSTQPEQTQTTGRANAEQTPGSGITAGIVSEGDFVAPADARNFSLSGYSRAVPSSGDINVSDLQSQYLSGSSCSVTSPEHGVAQQPGISMGALRDAASGLEGVSSGPDIDHANPLPAPTVSSPAAQASKGSIRGV